MVLGALAHVQVDQIRGVVGASIDAHNSVLDGCKVPRIGDSASECATDGVRPTGVGCHLVANCLLQFKKHRNMNGLRARTTKRGIQLGTTLLAFLQGYNRSFLFCQ